MGYREGTHLTVLPTKDLFCNIAKTPNTSQEGIQGLQYVWIQQPGRTGQENRQLGSRMKQRVPENRNRAMAQAFECGAV